MSLCYFVLSVRLHSGVTHKHELEVLHKLNVVQNRNFLLSYCIQIELTKPMPVNFQYKQKKASFYLALHLDI